MDRITLSSVKELAWKTAARSGKRAFIRREMSEEEGYKFRVALPIRNEEE